MNPEIITDIDLTDDQKGRIVRMIRGNGHVDYEGNYRSPAGAHMLKAVHFLSTPKDIPGGESAIDGVDGVQFETSPHIYLEDLNGALHGWKSARELKTSRWHYGIILPDDAGDLWFFGRDEVDGKAISLDAPILRRVRKTPSENVLEECGPLISSVPAEGEFWLSDEDEAVVTSIPWWSGFAGPDSEYASFENEREILATVRARIQIMLSTQASNPSNML